MNKKIILGVLAAALVGGGVVAVSVLPSTHAASSQSVVDDDDVETNDDGQEAQDTDTEVNDDQEVADADVAITEQQSMDIALKQVPGTVSSVELESEDGVSAYSVTIKDSAGKKHEVTVNAKTGEVIPEND